ncbi:hypothetical protein BDE36_1953 [Arcticibacter tournemirensis]|nr:hypothetical protein BDE36_1953 [Arcticibacter tournemirensis]
MNMISQKYYRVYKNETAVSEISDLDFKPGFATHFERGNIYSIPQDNKMFYDYTDRIDAMKKAKAGALFYINLLIKKAENGIDNLKQYRIDHYDDLNINLIDSNIRRLEREMHIK